MAEKPFEREKDYLITKLKGHNKNRYQGKLPGTGNHLAIYKSFLEKFRPITYESINDKKILEIVCNEDLMIRPFCCFVVHINERELAKIESLKLHLAQNFLINWNTYDKFIHKICQFSRDDIGIIDIIDVTADTLYDRYFDREIISSKDLYSCIMYLTVIPRGDQWRNGLYNQIIRDIITDRNNKGLITIVLYKGNIQTWKSDNIEENTFGVEYQHIIYTTNFTNGTYSKDTYINNPVISDNTVDIESMASKTKVLDAFLDD